MKKYELTGEKIIYLGKTLYRIKALVSFGFVKIGEIGGFIEQEYNLSHSGHAWVYGDARIYDYSKIYGNAIVFGDANIYDNAHIFGDAMVFGNASVFGNAKVYGEAIIYDDVAVYDNARVCENAEIYGIANVYGNVLICNNNKFNKGDIFE